MPSTRTIYARVYAPHPEAEDAGKYVRVMICEDGTSQLQVIDFAENLHSEAFAFFSKFDDHYMRLG